VQLESLIDKLDENDMEAVLCREITDCREEINRQMEITEKVTAQQKGNKKTYIDAENSKFLEMKKQFKYTFRF
jgi:nucleosome-remodeling factor subunit BPTF